MLQYLSRRHIVRRLVFEIVSICGGSEGGHIFCAYIVIKSCAYLMSAKVGGYERI